MNDSYKKGIFYGRTWGRNIKIKENLIKEYGKCFWCKIPVIMYPHIPSQNPPDNLATLDHLKSKNKGRKVGEVTPKVLSCLKCNKERK